MGNGEPFPGGIGLINGMWIFSHDNDVRGNLIGVGEDAIVLAAASDNRIQGNTDRELTARRFEARAYLGSTVVATDPGGHSSFAFILPVVSPGLLLGATATVATPGLPQDTSPLSPCVAVR